MYTPSRPHPRAASQRGRWFVLFALANAAAVVSLGGGACVPAETATSLPGTGGKTAATGGSGTSTGGALGTASGGSPATATGGTPATATGGAPAVGSGGSGGAGAAAVGTGGDGMGGASAGTGGGSGGASSGGSFGTGGGLSATGGGAVGGAGGRGATGGAAGGGAAVVSLFDGSTLAGWLPSSGRGLGNAPGSWAVVNGVIHCQGMVRGALISAKDYGSFRLMLEVRQTNTTHYASVLIWGTRPPPNDAIGGIQFGTPNASFWDYRPGHTGSVPSLWTRYLPAPSRTTWAQCELLANATTGVARLACCTVTGSTPCKAKEVLKFNDPTAGRVGPIALQAHDANAQDEYRNITIEENPAIDDLLTIR